MTALRIVVGLDGEPWVITADFTIHRRQAGNWQQLPGHAIDLSIGPEGSVWAIGASPPAPGHDGPVLRWTGEDWDLTGATGIAVAVGTDGFPWIVNSRFVVHRLARDIRWVEIPGCEQRVEGHVPVEQKAFAVAKANSGGGAGRPMGVLGSTRYIQ